MQFSASAPASLALFASAVALFSSATNHSSDRVPAAGGLTSRVADDSIYRLAVDSAAYKEYSFVYLLDDGVARYEADGKGSTTYRQVVQILKPSAVPQWAERSISYQPDREKITVNWMRVVRPNGEVVSEKPSQSQVSDVAAQISNPVYMQTKVIRYSLSNVTPGTLVDISWTKETITPPLTGDLLIGWNVTLPTPGMRSRFILDVPASYQPRILEHHLDFKRVDTKTGNRIQYTWARQDVKPVKTEIFAPDSSVPAMSIRIGAPLAWKDIGRWYYGLSKDRYSLSPTVTRSVDSVVSQAHSYQDTLKALHRWIARDLRYVSISLGIGGYQPRFPDSTVGTGYGDCKDKATLFIAAAAHVGITAHPVLLSSYGVADSMFPAIEQFNHVIAAVERAKVPGYTYLDLTTFDFPTGDIPPSYQGSFGLMVLRDGSSKSITFPDDGEVLTEQRIVGELSKEGRISGHYLVIPGGSSASVLRAAYSETIDSARYQMLKRNLPRPFPGASIDSVILFDGRDPKAIPKIEVILRDGEAAKSAGTMMILTVPEGFRGAGPYRALIEELQRSEKRTLPIDPSEIVGDGASKGEFVLTLPEGWTAQLPPNVIANSAFGKYRAEYSQVGRDLHILHEMSGMKAVQPATSIGSLIEWLQTIVKDNVEFVPLTIKN